MNPILRPTIAEIDLAKLTSNLQKIREKIGETSKILVPLKANAYGHGAVGVGSFLEKQHLCDFFGTASVEEGLELRNAGLKTPILVLGSIYPFEAFEYAINNNLSITIASVAAAKAVCSIASKLKKIALCHVKLDTGMGRIGTRKESILEVVKELHNKPFVVIEGLYTHFSSADVDANYTQTQLDQFEFVKKQLENLQIPVKIYHAAASPAMLARKDVYYDMVRPGHAVYGLEKGFEPILSIKTRIVYVKDVLAGSSISYGRNFIAKTAMKVATLPLGYGDGYLRAFSNKSHVLVKGVRCPVIGNVTMDMLMIDISAVSSACVGEEVVVVGKQGSEEITLAELATIAGTIDYELCTLLMQRVPRVYK